MLREAARRPPPAQLGRELVPLSVLRGEAANYPCLVIPAPAIFERKSGSCHNSIPLDRSLRSAVELSGMAEPRTPCERGVVWEAPG